MDGPDKFRSYCAGFIMVFICGCIIGRLMGHDWPNSLYITLISMFFIIPGIIFLMKGLFEHLDQQIFDLAYHDGQPLADGKRIGLIGTVEPIGAPVPSPFSKIDCALYEYQINEERPGKSGEWVAKSLVRGCAVTPCVIKSKQGSVKVLNTPLLTDFKVSIRQAKKDRVREHLKGLNITRLRRIRQDTSALDKYLYFHNVPISGLFQSHLVYGSASIGNLANRAHKILETIVPAGAEVCAIGIYSAKQRTFHGA